MNSTLLEDVNTFKYLGTMLNSDCSLDNKLRIRNSYFGCGETRHNMVSCLIKVIGHIHSVIHIGNMDADGKGRKKDTIIRE